MFQFSIKQESVPKEKEICSIAVSPCIVTVLKVILARFHIKSAVLESILTVSKKNFPAL